MHTQNEDSQLINGLLFAAAYAFILFVAFMGMSPSV
jgi:hypothetical protein